MGMSNRTKKRRLLERRKETKDREYRTVRAATIALTGEFETGDYVRFKITDIEGWWNYFRGDPRIMSYIEITGIYDTMSGLEYHRDLYSVVKVRRPGSSSPHSYLIKTSTLLPAIELKDNVV